MLAVKDENEPLASQKLKYAIGPPVTCHFDLLIIIIVSVPVKVSKYLSHVKRRIFWLPCLNWTVGVSWWLVNIMVKVTVNLVCL